MRTGWRGITAGMNTLFTFYLSTLKHLGPMAKPFRPKHTALRNKVLKGGEKEEKKLKEKKMEKENVRKRRRIKKHSVIVFDIFKHVVFRETSFHKQ